MPTLKDMLSETNFEDDVDEAIKVVKKWLKHHLRADDNEVGTGMWNAVVSKLMKNLTKEAK